MFHVEAVWTYSKGAICWKTLYYILCGMENICVYDAMLCNKAKSCCRHFFSEQTTQHKKAIEGTTNAIRKSMAG